MSRLGTLLLLASLFTVLVAARFESDDADRLWAVGKVLQQQIQPLLPTLEQFEQLSVRLWQQWPRRPVDDLRLRLQLDTRLQGLSISVIEEEGCVRLRGIVPDEQLRQCIYDLAVHTRGITTVIDELAIAVPPPPQPQQP